MTWVLAAACWCRPWKKSAFGDLNQHGPDAFKFYTKTKTVTARWPSGVKEGSEFHFKSMD